MPSVDEDGKHYDDNVMRSKPSSSSPFHRTNPHHHLSYAIPPTMAWIISVFLLIVATVDLVLPFVQPSAGFLNPVSKKAACSSSFTSLLSRIPGQRHGSKPALGNLLGLCKASQDRESAQQDTRLRKAGLRKRHVELLDGSRLFVVEAAKTSDMVEQWIENQMATVNPTSKSFYSFVG